MNKSEAAFRFIIVRRPVQGRLFALNTLDETRHRHQVQTLRRRLYETAGKVVYHAGAWCG